VLDENGARQLQIKKVRRDLLTTLKMAYPATMSFYDLRLVLPDIEERYLRVDLSYLMQKGYVIEENPRPNMTWDRREFKLSASGVETTDRINKDPALEP